MYKEEQDTLNLFSLENLCTGRFLVRKPTEINKKNKSETKMNFWGARAAGKCTVDPSIQNTWTADWPKMAVEWC